MGSERFDRGVRLYNESWTTDDQSHAIKNLELAQSLFEKALIFDSANPQLTKYSALVSHKLIGDKTFKRACTCRRQAAAAFQQKDYEFAYARYGDAIEDCYTATSHYDEGIKEDDRFAENLTQVQDQLDLVLEGRDRVRPLKDAEEKKREAERPIRKKILEEERKREQWLEEIEKEQKKKQIGRGLLRTGATVGGLALLAQGGPGSNDGSSSSMGLTSHVHDTSGHTSGIAAMSALGNFI